DPAHGCEVVAGHHEVAHVEDDVAAGAVLGTVAPLRRGGPCPTRRGNGGRRSGRRRRRTGRRGGGRGGWLVGHDDLLFRRGSSTSRRPSPRRFRPSTAITIARPGQMASGLETPTVSWASLRSMPQETSGRLMPTPR